MDVAGQIFIGVLSGCITSALILLIGIFIKKLEFLGMRKGFIEV